MAKTSVDIDVDKLDKVREILGTESIRETINAAFREVIRIAAVRDLWLSARRARSTSSWRPVPRSGCGGNALSRRQERPRETPSSGRPRRTGAADHARTGRHLWRDGAGDALLCQEHPGAVPHEGTARGVPGPCRYPSGHLGPGSGDPGSADRTGPALLRLDSRSHRRGDRTGPRPGDPALRPRFRHHRALYRAARPLDSASRHSVIIS